MFKIVDGRLYSGVLTAHSGKGFTLFAIPLSLAEVAFPGQGAVTKQFIKAGAVRAAVEAAIKTHSAEIRKQFLRDFDQRYGEVDFTAVPHNFMMQYDLVLISDEKAGPKWFEAKCHTLRHDPNGVVIVIDALRYLLRKGRGSAEIPEIMGYFRNNSRRMNYYLVANNGYPIGSDEVEAANKVLVAECLKRFGQRWGRDDRRRVLAYCALLKSNHFDRA